MASGNNIYSKLNIEKKKKGLQQSTKSSKGDGDKTSGVSTARPPVPRNNNIQKTFTFYQVANWLNSENIYLSIL